MRQRLDSDTVVKIAQAMKRGLHYKQAAALAGVHHSSVHRWMQRGADAIATIADGHAVSEFDQLCADLVCAIDLAEAEHADEHITAVLVEADARTRLKWLQVRFPELYGEVKQGVVKHGLEDGAQATLEETLAELGIAFDNQNE